MQTKHRQHCCLCILFHLFDCHERLLEVHLLNYQNILHTMNTGRNYLYHSWLEVHYKNLWWNESRLWKTSVFKNTEIFWNLFFAQGLYWADNQSLDENATKRRVFCWPKMDFTVLKDQNKSLTLKASLISTISFTLLTTHCQTILLIDQLKFCQGTI